MKIKLITLCLLSLLLTVLFQLFGCASSSRLDMTETVGTQTDAVPYITEALPITERSAPMTDAIPQTEAPTAQAITELITEAAPAAEPPTETESVPAAPAYITLPRMSTKPFAEVGALLNDAGLAYTVEEQYSKTYEKGTVINVRFHGSLDEEFCRINPEYPVEIVVSLGRRYKTNASAVDPKRIYLTFDDGPHPNTDRVLEILAEYDIRATFFTLGMYAAVYPERICAIEDGGHLLACHSYSHDYLTLYASADSVLAEIRSWEKAIEKAGAVKPKTVFFRFPGGSTTAYMDEDRCEDIFWAITDAGYLAMDWTLANNDRYLNGKTEEETIQDYLLRSTAVTLDSLAWCPSVPKVMLLHDTADETVETLPQILEYLIGEGYTFGTLDELDGYWVFQ